MSPTTAVQPLLDVVAALQGLAEVLTGSNANLLVLLELRAELFWMTHLWLVHHTCSIPGVRDEMFFLIGRNRFQIILCIFSLTGLSDLSACRLTQIQMLRA